MATTRPARTQVDDLLRRGVLVDLLHGREAGDARRRRVVRAEADREARRVPRATADDGLRCGRGARVRALARDPATQAELDAIESYNDEDCRATVALFDWLLAERPAPTWLELGWTSVTMSADGARPKRARGAAPTLVTGEEAGSERWLAGELLEYHRREARQRGGGTSAHEMDDEELLADSEALAGLAPDGDHADRRTTVELTLSFPAAGAQDRPETPTTIRRPGTASPCPDRRRGGHRRGARAEVGSETPPRAAHPADRPDGQPSEALLRARHAGARRDDGSRHCASAAPRPPRIAASRRAPIQTTELDEQRPRPRSRREHLVVQGPPGTGKT